jgi:hypothetical protein
MTAMANCPCGPKTPEVEAPRAGHVYRGGRLVRPLRWHRDAGGYYTDGTLGRYTIRRQRPYRPKGILPRVLTIPDGRQRSFEKSDEAKAFAAHYDEIVPKCTPVMSPAPAIRPYVPELPIAPSAPDQYTPYGMRREELLDRYARARTAAAPMPTARDHGISNGPCLPWVRLEVDQQRYRACMAIAERHGQVDGPTDLVPVLQEALGREDQEIYCVAGLDAHLKLRALAEIGRGARDRVPTSIADTARYGVAFANSYGAMGVVIAHVHPSGEIRPSEADDEVTEAVKASCDANGLCFLDHIICSNKGDGSHYSYRDHGRIKD